MKRMLHGTSKFSTAVSSSHPLTAGGVLLAAVVGESMTKSAVGVLIFILGLGNAVQAASSSAIKILESMFFMSIILYIL